MFLAEASVFAYIGPETILPATSALAAVGGLLLAFGRTITRPIFALCGRLFGRKGAAPASDQTQIPG